MRVVEFMGGIIEWVSTNYVLVREHNFGADLLQNKHLDLDRPNLPIIEQPRRYNILF